MSYRLLLLFVVAVQFDGLATILRFQAPAGLSWAFEFWKEFFLIALAVPCCAMLFRSTQSRPAAPLGVAAAWVLLIAVGCLGLLVSALSGAADLWQALVVFRKTCLFALLFGMLIMPSRPLPQAYERHLLDSLAGAALIVVAIAGWQSRQPEAWVNHPWIDQAAAAGALSIRSISGIFRPFATFSSPFIFGGFCAIVFILTLASLLFQDQRRRIYWIVLAAAGLGLYWSTIRTAILGALMGGLYLCGVRSPAFRGMGRRITLIVLLIAAGMALPFLTAGVKSGTAENRASGYLASESLAARLAGWEQASDLLESPRQMCWGLGSGAVAGGSRIGSAPSAGMDKITVDNFYLVLLINHGLLGVFVWGVFCLQLLWLLLRGSMADATSNWLVHGAAALLVYLAVSSLFHQPIMRPPEAVLLWTLMGVAAVRARQAILCEQRS